MNIYQIDRKGPTGWDEYDGFVVVADTPRNARKYAAEMAGSWDNCDWTSSEDATIKNIGTAHDLTKAGVVLGSYNAG